MDQPDAKTLCSAALDRICQCLNTGKYDPLPDEFADNVLLRKILDDLVQTLHSLSLLARGELSTPVPLKGYVGGTLKSLQSNLRHVIWKARQIAAGDFSQQIDFMGDISDVFNAMGRELEQAQTQLQAQKENLARITENLRAEIAARTVIEAKLRRKELRLQKLAAEDPLTGIANRRNFFMLARREIERMRRVGRPICLAMLDIDHFKELNDTFGHRQGDNALRQLTKLITRAIRPYDIAGRYGGDEFTILLPETTGETACAVLERLRISVVESHAGNPKKVPALTISAGVSAIDTSLSAAKALDLAVSLADRALYQSKLKGRNHVHLA